MTIPLLAFFLFLSSKSIFANNAGVELGNPTSHGSGCTPGTVSFLLSPDGSTLSVLFDAFLLESDQAGISLSKVCNISVPIKIPEGNLLSVIQADYRGFNSLPAHSVSEFNADYDFQNGPLPKRKKTEIFKGPLNGEFFSTTREHARSPCNSSITLNISTSLRLVTGSRGAMSYTQLDSADISSPHRKKNRKQVFKINLKKCN